MKSTLWRLAAVALLVGTGIVMAPADPSHAWDDPNQVLTCGQAITLQTPFGATARYDKTGKTSVEVIRFLDAEKKPVDGHAWRHYYSTTVAGGLKFVVSATKVVISAPKCPPPPPRTPDPERVVVECNTDPFFEWHPSKGQSAVWTWLASNHTTGKLVIYLNSRKRLEEGQAQVYLFSTHEDCSLKIVKDKNSINIWASKKN